MDFHKLEKEAHSLIDYLRKERKLSEAECLAVLNLCLESFPKEYIYLRGNKNGK